MKCKVHKCNAQCCYNLAFGDGELEKFADKIVNPVLGTMPFGPGVLALTSKKMDDNKCPFLREDLRCNIYECRPDVCRKFGMIKRLPCRFLK